MQGWNGTDDDIANIAHKRAIADGSNKWSTHHPTEDRLRVSRTKWDWGSVTGSTVNYALLVPVVIPVYRNIPFPTTVNIPATQPCKTYCAGQGRGIAGGDATDETIRPEFFFVRWRIAVRSMFLFVSLEHPRGRTGASHGRRPVLTHSVGVVRQ